MVSPSSYILELSSALYLNYLSFVYHLSIYCMLRIALKCPWDIFGLKSMGHNYVTPEDWEAILKDYLTGVQ